MAERLLGSLVVIGLLAFAGASAVLFDADERRASDPKPPQAAPAKPQPKRTPSDGTGPRMSGRYPKACLRPVARPGPFGLVAAYRSGAIMITDTDGVVQATIRAPRVVRPPLAWSPSGRILAAGPQGLFWRSDGTVVFIGDVQHGLVPGLRGVWGWSPLSDCGVHIDENGALLVTSANPHVAGAGQPLVDGGVESFSYSPNGRKLGLVLEHGDARSIWIADLVTNRLRLVKDFPRATCCISLEWWTPTGNALMFRAGPGSSVMADGWPLTTVGPRGRLEEWGAMVPGADLQPCGERLLGVVGGDRSGDAARLAELRAGEDPLYLSEVSDAVRSFSCSPDGRFIAVQTDARLALFDDRGARLRHLTDIDTANGQWSERAPEWGPPRTGILFVRSMHLQAQLWFLAEGQVTERAIADLELTGRWDVRSLFDWSATPPSGLPAG